MNIDYLPRAMQALKDAPADVRKAFFKQVTVRPSLLRLYLMSDCFHMRTQYRQMDRDNLPNAHEVYSQVIVDQNVPEARNSPPVNLGMKGLQMVADPLGGFGEGVEIAQNSVLNQFRPAKSIFATLAIPIYAPDASQDVIDVEAVIPHKRIAS